LLPLPAGDESIGALAEAESREREAVARTGCELFGELARALEAGHDHDFVGREHHQWQAGR